MWRRINCIAVFLAAFSLCESVKAGDEQRDTPQETLLNSKVTVPLDCSHGKPVVSVKINGKGPYPFILDTGAGGTVINADLVAELKLPKIGTSEMGDPSNPKAIKADRVHAEKIEIGGATFVDLEMVSWDRSALYPFADAPRGVLGFPLFSQCLLSIDIGHDRLELTRGELPSVGEKGILGFTIGEGGIPVIDVNVAGKSYHAHIDTGSMGGLSVSTELAEQLPLKSKPVVVGRGRTVNSDFEVRSAGLDADLIIAGQVISKPQLESNPIVKAVNIGCRLLDDFVVTIDQKNQLMLIQPGDKATKTAHNWSPRRQVAGDKKGGKPRLGVMLAKRKSGDQQQMIVDKVVDGSPAEKAGVKSGDRLISIGGRDPISLDDDALRKALRGDCVELVIDRDGEQKKINVRLANE